MSDDIFQPHFSPVAMNLIKSTQSGHCKLAKSPAREYSQLDSTIQYQMRQTLGLDGGLC